MAKRHMKRHSTLLIIRKLQVKSTMRYHLTPVRLGIIKKSTNNKCWRRCGEKGTLLYYWWECKLVQSLWGLTWRFLKELNSELPYDPAIPFLGISQFSSVAQSSLILCDPMDCNTPGFPVHHQIPELAQTHVLQVSDAIQPFHPLLVIREMQTNTTMRYHLTPVRMAIIKKSTNNKCWRGFGEK